MKVINCPILSRASRALLLAAILPSPMAFAVTANVTVNGASFDPAGTVINVNDTVKWTWASDFHNSVNTNGLWSSPIQNNGATFTHTFPAQGEFFYECSIHGFWGAVSVLSGPAATNINVLPDAFDPPSVSVKVNDKVRWTWVSDFHNTASDSSIWDSGIFDTGFVYEFTFTSPGTFGYSCQVHGFTGAITVQSPTVPPALLSGPKFIPPSTFQFNYSANSGSSYVV